MSNQEYEKAFDGFLATLVLRQIDSISKDDDTDQSARQAVEGK